MSFSYFQRMLPFSIENVLQYLPLVKNTFFLLARQASTTPMLFPQKLLCSFSPKTLAAVMKELTSSTSSFCSFLQWSFWSFLSFLGPETTFVSHLLFQCPPLVPLNFFFFTSQVQSNQPTTPAFLLLTPLFVWSC